MTGLAQTPSERAVDRLDGPNWAAANAALIAKTLSEFAHERLIVPVPDSHEECLDDNRSHAWRVVADDPAVVYRFVARRFWLDHWHIEPATIGKVVAGAPAPLDAAALFIECRAQLGLSETVLALYLEEIASTLYSACYKRRAGPLAAAAFVDADFQQIEAAMTEGHPAFVANNGRIGFDSMDYRAYAPEAAAPIRLIWIAVHTSRAAFSVGAGRTVESHLDSELDAETRAEFRRRLVEANLAPDDYHFMPVHPWQWHNKLVFAFAGEIASRYLVYLGFAPDGYQAQQSIRTLFNRDTPTRCYVKMSLSILNMGFTRGLSPYYMAGTPAICDWVDGLVRGDAYLCQTGFSILREVAAIGYRHPLFEAAAARTDGANKMLSALWRESPLAGLGKGERLMTMAALLHSDYDGRSVVGALIDASGRSIDDWLSAYLDAYLRPILHCFYAHELVFMPHGENLILVLDAHVPVRAIMKDIAEEIAVMNPAADLPPEVARIAVEVPEELKILSLFTDLFDLIFRYLAAILAIERDYPQNAFWQRVADCVHAYQAAHPQYADRFARYDLFAEDFARSCVNRLQLRDNRQMIDLSDPAGHLQLAGRLINPIAGR
ncbi:IucA/IucC family protein [Salinisphaera sp. T31B1]|uniref:IucA/IucC family protein n=1 Tax=Salinisphaera sp. T31B1 TaxID=727963 RepID=UPI0033408731